MKCKIKDELEKKIVKGSKTLDQKGFTRYARAGANSELILVDNAYHRFKTYANKIT